MIEGQPTIAPEFTEAMSDLGIDPATMDDGGMEFEESEVESTEAEGEAPSTEEVEGEESEEPESQEAPSSEGEEQAVTTTEAVEAQKPTAKELQEIEAKQKDLDARVEKFHTDMELKEKEFHEKYQAKLEEHASFDAFLDGLAQNDPSLFDLVKDAFTEHQKQFSNPVLDETRKRLASIEKELSGFKAKASDEVTLTKLEAEKSEVMGSLGKEAETLGLKVDVKQIEDLWAKGLTFREAFNAKYGDAMRKAALSKAKVEIAEKKVAARPTVSTAGSVKRASTSAGVDFSKMSTRELLAYEARKLTGRAS